MVELCYKCSSRGTQLDQMEHQMFTQRSLWTSILEQNIHSILEITGCDRCLVAIENQILLTKVIKYICGWLVLLKMSALKSMKLIFLYSLFGVTKLFMLVYVKQSYNFPDRTWLPENNVFESYQNTEKKVFNIDQRPKFRKYS